MRSTKWRLIIGILIAGLTADQLTKRWAVSALSGGRTIELIPTLELDLVFNRGFSFGLGARFGALVGVLVIAVSCFIGYQLWRETNTWRAAIFAAILAGAIGNLSDRIFRAEGGFLSGDVVDFIDVTWYAVFNVADMMVVCGCGALIAFELFHRRQTSNKIQAAEVPATPVSQAATEVPATPATATPVSQAATEVPATPATATPAAEAATETGYTLDEAGASVEEAKPGG